VKDHAVVDVIKSNKLGDCWTYAACLTIDSSRLSYAAQWKAEKKEEDHQEVD